MGIEDDEIVKPQGIESDESAGNSLSAFSRGALGSGVESTGLVGGALLGAPFGPLGAILGGGAGYLAGNLARRGLSQVNGPISGKPLAYEHLEDVPKEDRPAAVGGEVMGGGGPFAMGAYRMAGTMAAPAPAELASVPASVAAKLTG